MGHALPLVIALKDKLGAMGARGQIQRHVSPSTLRSGFSMALSIAVRASYRGLK